MRPARGVRAGDQAELLEVGHHVADRRRRQLQAATRATACASPPAGRRRCSARPGFSADLGTLVEHAIVDGPCRRRRFSPAVRQRSLWCNPANGDPLPARCARRQVPAPKAIRDELEDDRRVPGRARASRCRLEHDTARQRPASTATRAAAPRSASACDLAVVRRRRRHDARHRAASSRATACRSSASTRAGSASSPTSRSDDFATALAPMLAGDYEEEQRSHARRRASMRDGEAIFEAHRDERRRRQPRRDRPAWSSCASTSTAISSPTCAPTA